jgi:hypothetical protein
MKRDFIESRDVGERDLYADMIMRSLRGNWNCWQDRTEILETIADVGGLLYYDDLGSKARSYRKKTYHDGRYFRGYYGEVDVSDFDESVVRECATHIPHDMTWGDWKIHKVFEDDN